MKKNLLSRAFKVVVVFLLSALATACLENNPENLNPDPDPTPSSEETVINPKTVILDASRMDQIVEYNNEYMIVKDLSLGTPLSSETRASSFVKAQEEYYFICTATDQIPEGAFKKIKEITPYGNQYKVTFDPLSRFGLQDVILNGSCNKAIPHATIESVTDEEGKRVEVKGNIITVKVGSNVFSGEENVKFDFVLTVEFDCSPEIKISIKDGVPTFKFGMEVNPDVKVTTDFALKYKKTLMDEDDFRKFMEKTLKIKFATVTVPVGPVPVAVTPEVDFSFEISLSGEVHAKGTLVHWKPSYSCGMELFMTKEGDKEPEIKPYFDKNPPEIKPEFFKDVEMTAEGTLKESASFVGKAKLYGTLTGALEAEVYAKQKLTMGGVYDPSSNEVSAKPIEVKPSAGVEGTAKAYLDLFKWKPEIKGTWTVVEFDWDPWIITDFKSAPVVVTADEILAFENSMIVTGAALADETQEETRITECGFEYYSDDSAQVTKVLSKMDGRTYFDGTIGLMKRFVSTIEDLQPDTKYHVRAYATNGKGTRYGNYVQVYTKGSGIKTLTAIKVRAKKATVPVTLTSSFEIQEKGVIYSKTPDPTMSSEGVSKVLSDEQSSKFEVELTGLDPLSTYYARGYVIVNSDNTSQVYLGNVISFQTLATGPQWSGEIVMERKYFIHDGGDYANQSFSLVFDNDQALKVGYYDTNYWTSYSNGRHGLYISFGGEEWYVQARSADQWVQEKIVINSGGSVQYYSDGALVGEHVFDSVDVSEASSFYLDMDPWGWNTGHQHFMDDFKLTTPHRTIEDNFDNGFNLGLWEKPVFPDGVYVDQGVMKAHQNKTDKDYHLRSKEISLVSGATIPYRDGEEIELSRKYYLHDSGQYNYQTMSFVFNNEQSLTIGYYNANYWTSYNDGRHGVYLTSGGLECYMQSKISDEWVQEKVTVTTDGKVRYYTNGELVGERIFSVLDLETASSFYLDMNPWGWNTGHQHFMDDFTLKTPYRTITDNFDQGTFDLDIWEKPVFPDGVYVDQGVMKANQIRTDKDFHLRSREISLTSGAYTPHPKGKEIELTRKYNIHSSGQYAYHSTSFVFENTKSLTVGYYDTNYWTSYNDGRHGIYLKCGDYECYMRSRISDEWVQEKIVITTDGKVRYYTNGEFLGERVFSELTFDTTEKYHVEMSPWGWFTGHTHFVDDFRLTQPGFTLSDNFDGNKLDLYKWEEPINPDGVYLKDGYLQMHQLRTDQDFILRSKSIQFPK